MSSVTRNDLKTILLFGIHIAKIDGDFAVWEKKVLARFAEAMRLTEEEKHAVLDAQLECIRAVVPAWRTLAEQGKVELTATPYYHPILPLVCDSDAAHRALPGLELPPRFRRQPVSECLTTHPPHLP